VILWPDKPDYESGGGWRMSTTTSESVEPGGGNRPDAPGAGNTTKSLAVTPAAVAGYPEGPA
jgi:hypothetical protein